MHNKYKSYKVNLKGRDFICGDIHGMFHLVTDEMVKHNFNTKTDRLFCTGDLVDRGEYSSACLTWLAKPWFHSVLGNHELLLLQYQDSLKLYPKERVMKLYENNGAQWFLELKPEIQQEYLAAFKQLPVLLDLRTKSRRRIGVLHGGVIDLEWCHITSSVINEYNTSVGFGSCTKDIVWNRPINNTEYFVKGVDEVYCGHTPMREPKTLGNITYIDTGAAYGGKLTFKELI